MSSLAYFLSLSISLRDSIHSQNLTWASEGVFGLPARTSLCKEIENLDSSIKTGVFATMSKGGTHPQLT